MGRAIHAPEMWARRSCWIWSLLLGPESWVIVIGEMRLGSGRKKKYDELMFGDIDVEYLCIYGASKMCVWCMLVYKDAMQ